MTMAERQKQRKPMAKWTGNVDQKFLRSRRVFSEMRVIMPESIRICQPEGKHLRNENEEEGPCRKIWTLKQQQEKPVNILDSLI